MSLSQTKFSSCEFKLNMKKKKRKMREKKGKRRKKLTYKYPCTNHLAFITRFLNLFTELLNLKSISLMFKLQILGQILNYFKQAIKLMIEYNKPKTMWLVIFYCIGAHQYRWYLHNYVMMLRVKAL